ncbi:hypothetical protein ACROYT_G014263 [Oculina patagonica]
MLASSAYAVIKPYGASLTTGAKAECPSHHQQAEEVAAEEANDGNEQEGEGKGKEEDKEYISTLMQIEKEVKMLWQGDVQCRKVGRRSISSLHQHEQFVLKEAALANPSMTLNELCMELEHSTGSEYCMSTVHRNLKRFGFSFKKDKRLVRRWGYGLIGTQASIERYFAWAPRVSAIAVMAANVNVAKFLHFLEKDLVPILQPFNGINHNSIVVMGEFEQHNI